MNPEEFTSLTPRQFKALHKIIQRQEAVEFFLQISAHAAAVGTKIELSLNEYLAIVFKEEAPSEFTNDTDKKLEEIALNKFKEAQKNHGG